MFDNKDNKKSEEKQALCGCGSITEAQADALIKKVSSMEGIPNYFANGVAVGMYFASLESGNMRGTTIEEFVQNAHDAYIAGAAENMVDNLVARKVHGMGGILKVEVRRG
ncbi:MAG: hypothetical protein RSG23_10545 [Gordonibacter sp.]|uniref:hypothetical protein n=1 Tax=Gordonibacter sp. TaxID=1968902 RepID=UPI002FCC52D1